MRDAGCGGRLVRTGRRLAALGLVVVLAGCGLTGAGGHSGPGVDPVEGRGGGPVPDVGQVPRPAHVVVVVFENKNARTVLGNPRAPFLNGLARRGATMRDSFGVAHPSQPNYLALFSGSMQGVGNDSCPHTFPGRDDLGAQLRAAGDTFRAYTEDLPSPGFTGCRNGDYERVVAPWTDFPNVPANTALPLGSFPRDYRRLPTLSFVVPDLCHDMHNCSVATGDRWARAHLARYARWATSHHSLLLVTFDEDDDTRVNRIPTVLVGQPVRPGRYHEHVDHYTMLRTLEAMYGLVPLGAAADRTPVTDVWS